MANARHDQLTGREIDGYRIQAVLGRGGMGIVYQAEDVALSRTVALKMIDPALARDEAFVRRFRSEARALARVDSPYIVAIHALRVTEAGMFIVMEYVDGGTLADRIDRGAVPWEEAYPIVRQMLMALEQAHGVGVIHRDIKPRNVMLSTTNVVKVTDFGLAKLRQSDGASTVTQGVAGTLYYMSPEQVKGLRDLDHRSDLYALGMTMYEMLTGQLPFDRDAGEFSIMRAIVEQKPPPPTDYRANLPAPVCAIIMRALEKDPDRRYASAREMLDAVEAFEVRRRDGDGENEPAPRRKVVARVAAAVLAVVVLAAAYGLYGRFGAADAATERVVPFPEDTPLADAPVDALMLDGEVVAERVQEVSPGGTEPPADGAPTERGGSGTGEGPAEPAPLAAVTLRAAEPGVQILAADEKRAAPATFHWAAGTHAVTFWHPLYKERREEITVRAGEEDTLTYYFTGTVDVVDPVLENGDMGPWAVIWIDGETRDGWFTPKLITVGPGVHTISLKLTGYEFMNNDQRVEVVPGFQRSEHTLRFRMRKQ